jgi:hypothetical protein
LNTSALITRFVPTSSKVDGIFSFSMILALIFSNYEAYAGEKYDVLEIALLIVFI